MEGTFRSQVWPALYVICEIQSAEDVNLYWLQWTLYEKPDSKQFILSLVSDLTEDLQKKPTTNFAEDAEVWIS